MSTYKIYPDSLLRLAKVLTFFESNVSDETKAKINTIRIENKGGQSLAVATNRKIASIENLGPTTFPDGVCHLKITPYFLDAAKRAAQKNSSIIITVIPALAMATAQLSASEYISDACLWFDSTPLDDWRSWVVKAPEVSTGIMCWDLFHVETLISASPSGKVVFPEYIDASKPLMIRDRYRDQEWIGIFLPGETLPPDAVREINERMVPAWLGV